MTDQPTADIAGPLPDADTVWKWAHIEVFGHRSHTGRIREVEQFGTKMLRIEVPVFEPVEGGKVIDWEVHDYGGASIFSISPCTEVAGLNANRPYIRRSYQLPSPTDGAVDDEDIMAAVEAEQSPEDGVW